MFLIVFYSLDFAVYSSRKGKARREVKKNLSFIFCLIERASAQKKVKVMKATTISKIKVGQYFTFKPIENPTEKQVYVRGEYEKSLKKYEYYKFTDICSYNYAKRDRIVYIDFEF